MTLLVQFIETLLATLGDLLPIAAVLLGFQFLVIRHALAHARRIVAGFVYVVIGLALFLLGLETALFPIGRIMAEQLTAPDFIGAAAALGAHWSDYLWVYAFAAAIGFTATIAEPALIAVALKAHEVSGGTISPWGLRLAVALGAAVGVSVGAFRIVIGASVYYFIIAGYLIVIAQTIRVDRGIIPLAYDSGGVTTSTVTVPLVAALGLGLASAIPGRSPLIDGFGLIALTCLFPVISVLGYAQMTSWRQRRGARRRREE